MISWTILGFTRCKARSWLVMGWERDGSTNIDLYGIPLSEAPHVTLGKQTIGKQRQENKLGKRQQFISGQNKPSSPIKASVINALGSGISMSRT